MINGYLRRVRRGCPAAHTEPIAALDALKPASLGLVRMRATILPRCIQGQPGSAQLAMASWMKASFVMTWADNTKG